MVLPLTSQWEHHIKKHERSENFHTMNERVARELIRAFQQVGHPCSRIHAAHSAAATFFSICLLPCCKALKLSFFCTYNSQHPPHALEKAIMALPKTLQPSLTPDELTFLAEEEVIDIVPLPDRVSTLAAYLPHKERPKISETKAMVERA